MEVVKRAIFGSMGFILLFMFIAYGLNVLSGFRQATTYLTAETYTTTYGFTFIKYTWDYIGYTNNLAQVDVWITIRDNLFRTDILENAWESMKQYAVQPDNVWQALINGIMFVATILKTMLNVIIMALNIILVGPLQVLLAVTYYIFTLLGINMTNGSWWLANTINWIRNNFYIPLI